MSASPKTNGPLVTFALFAYNHEQYIREAVQGALAQTYQPLQVVLSDDCSTDRTYQVMREEAEKYTGPHTIKLKKNTNNLGLVRHVNRLFELAAGDIIVVAAGDDISYPFRTERIVRKFAECNPLLVHSQADEIDVNGKRTGELQPDERLFRSSSIAEAALSPSLYLGASAAWAKELFTIFGPLEHDKAYEDLTLGFRAIMQRRFESIHEPLLQYRVGGGLTTSSREHQTFSSLWKQRKKYVVVMYDVLRQRQKDYRRASVCEEAVEKELAAKTKDLRIKAKLYENPKSIPRLISDEHFSAIKNLFYEIAYLTKCVIAGNKK